MAQIPRRADAFTLKANGKLNEIITDAGVSLPFVGTTTSPFPNGGIEKIKALWDTGATGCSITKIVAEKLGLKPISKAQVHHADGMSIVDVYLLNIYLPNNIAITSVHVLECKSTSGKFDLIIGMNVITLGDFTISNFEGKTFVSFRVPSMGATDFVDEFSKIKQGNSTIPIPSVASIPRNRAERRAMEQGKKRRK